MAQRYRTGTAVSRCNSASPKARRLRAGRLRWRLLPDGDPDMTRASNRLLLAALVLLSACASKPDGPVEELRPKRAPPTSTAVEARGRSVYVYARSGKVGGPAGPVTFSCVVRYAVVAERVTGHSIEGC